MRLFDYSHITPRWCLAHLIGELVLVGFVMMACWLVLSPKVQRDLQPGLNAARATWDAAHISDYTMTVREWPLGSEYRLTVQAGQIVAAEARPALTLGTPQPFAPIPVTDATRETVDRLFRRLAEQFTNVPPPHFPFDNVTVYTVTYDSALGYPISFEADECSRGLFGLGPSVSECRWGFEVTAFEVLSDPTP